MKAIMFLPIALLLTSCVKATFTPETLPDARLNQPYTAKIMIGGGTAIPNGFYQKISSSEFTLNPTMQTTKPHN